jgi:hypothetical protein
MAKFIRRTWIDHESPGWQVRYMADESVLYGTGVGLSLLIAIFLAGCGSTYGKPPVTTGQLRTFTQDYSASVSGDEELRGVFKAVSQAQAGRSGIEAAVLVDGRSWVALNRAQKDRLMRKASLLLRDACRPYHAVHGSVCGIRLVDDTEAIWGFAVAGGTNPDAYDYQLFQ